MILAGADRVPRWEQRFSCWESALPLVEEGLLRRGRRVRHTGIPERPNRLFLTRLGSAKVPELSSDSPQRPVACEPCRCPASRIPVRLLLVTFIGTGIRARA